MPAVVEPWIKLSGTLLPHQEESLNFLCRIWPYVHTLTYMVLSSSFAAEMKKSAGDQVVISSWWPDVGGFLQIILCWTNQTLLICKVT